MDEDNGIPPPMENVSPSQRDSTEFFNGFTPRGSDDGHISSNASTASDASLSVKDVEEQLVTVRHECEGLADDINGMFELIEGGDYTLLDVDRINAMFEQINALIEELHLIDEQLNDIHAQNRDERIPDVFSGFPTIDEINPLAQEFDESVADDFNLTPGTNRVNIPWGYKYVADLPPLPTVYGIPPPPKPRAVLPVCVGINVGNVEAPPPPPPPNNPFNANGGYSHTTSGGSIPSLLHLDIAMPSMLAGINVNYGSIHRSNGSLSQNVSASPLSLETYAASLSSPAEDAPSAS